ncbi:TPA: bifunctional acetaldehyde-CoA/alcohol dehydrogenase [Clostridioides difficile]|uniref:bifunctional acetaldehyde-CoA/alcohol dehydrogenase n=1 Tax=Clostridioides difficile TaxID=1496 RepID=UPI00093AA48F|nr:bifunctional acetaldehyde-CoA/alcohol dehydrogenase [Clostridioides difficile]EGT4698120.1 bifunctional acetaldehyde-CoA/alcohol dehydrogenase [Clostridioides difficile]EGT4916117.1 bifunctional acetaldehyde-CoA/alcohol dehydrogenase [Clostridioides difficile]EII6782260.1 bifunctional acetaldehyde-CoA/alcohol dehydrogenase [Clostridioides difficile]MBH7451449.1 bifunctional acetaldehyde-CoA/alcohol dehydrogenase [Clostridioides difficile]MBH8114877.1 bifunctional acetaldehyde-CoA/alcohol de
MAHKEQVIIENKKENEVMSVGLDTVNNVESLVKKLAKIREAQKIFATYTQEQVDKIFLAASLAANKQRVPLAIMAQKETGMGIAEDKVIKNHYASEYIYNAYKETKTCGVIEKDEAFGMTKIAEPIGVIAAVVPTTNPTSTAIFKALLALKTRNGIIFSPHPRAKNSTIEAAKVVLEAAVLAGAPEGIIGWIDEPSLELTTTVMKEVDLTLATGGPGMVKSAYSSGKPAIGVGAGNTPAIIDESADIKTAVNSILVSKTFDNGMICASEQSVIVLENIYNEVKKEFKERGAYLLDKDETEKIRNIILVNGGLNSKIVGQTACTIAKLAGFEVPVDTKVLIGEVESVEIEEAFAHEKLSPVLAMYKASDFDDAVRKAEKLVEDGGFGHTSSLYIDDVNQREKLDKFTSAMKTCRILINTPSSQGGIGDLYNFKLAPSLTLGCGSWGGNSVSENVGVKHLLNIKTVAERRENMLWFRAPGKVYFKKGCLGVALKELKDVMNKKRAFIVTDTFLYNNGYTKAVTDLLDEMNIKHTTFFEVEPDPTLECAKIGAKAMREFNPDVIISIGGGSAMDAGKIMWTLYEHPDVDFQDLAMRFMDIRKRVYTFPKMGEKANFVAIPTSAGTGSEVTPFAVITDQDTGVKYPLADYELMPNMAIVDSDMMMNMPKSLTSASGIDALTHALEAYVSMLATDYTNGLALQAIKSIFEYLPRAYDNGAKDPEAREKMANASTMAGMAFANAFLGVCHSMAHKLGAFHHVPHGVANALLITEVMKFNSSDAPKKMGAFSQYKYPEALKRYAEIASFLGLKGNSDEEKFQSLLVAIEDLKLKVGIPKSIKEFGVEEPKFMDSIDEMVIQAFDDQCTGANPRYPLMNEIKDMYLNSYYGR